MSGLWMKLGWVSALALVAAVPGSLLSSTPTHADGPTVAIEGFHAGPEQVADTTVTASKLTEPGLGAWTVDVHYNPEVLNALECGAEHGGICNPEFEPGVIRIVGTNVEGITGETVLGGIAFACKTLGEHGLELKVETFVDATPGEPKELDVNVEHGRALCKEEPKDPPQENLPGDLDCDTHVTTIDAILLLQYEAQLIDGTECLKNADVNGDEQVSVLDAILILQIVAGLID